MDPESFWTLWIKKNLTPLLYSHSLIIKCIVLWLQVLFCIQRLWLLPSPPTNPAPGVRVKRKGSPKKMQSKIYFLSTSGLPCHLILGTCCSSFPLGVSLPLDSRYLVLYYVPFRNVPAIRFPVPAAVLFSRSSSDKSSAIETRRPCADAS